MLGLLRLDGPSTASRLAERLRLNSGATSYHLRQLALHGFIVEDPNLGDGRDRWWRAAHRSTHTADDTSPEARDAQDAFSQAVAVVHRETVQRAIEERPLLPEQWWRTTMMSDWAIRLGPADGIELLERLVALFAEFAGREVSSDDPTDDVATLIYQVQAFPVPGTVAGDPE